MGREAGVTEVGIFRLDLERRVQFFQLAKGCSLQAEIHGMRRQHAGGKAVSSAPSEHALGLKEE